MEYSDQNLEFLIKNIPNKYFLNIVKESGGLLGSPTKNLNTQYKNYLVNKALKKNVSLKVRKAIINEITRIVNDSNDNDNEKSKLFRNLSKSYLENDNKKFEDYKQKYLQIKKYELKNKTTVIKSNIEKTNLDKIIEKQKLKIKSINEKEQANLATIKKLKKEGVLLKKDNQKQKQLITKQKEQIINLHQKINKIESELKLKRSANNNNNFTEKENKQLILKIHSLKENISSLRKENSLIKADRNELQGKLIELTCKRFLLIGMPIGFKYGSIKIPVNTEFKIAVSNSVYSIFNDEQIIGYSSIEDIIQQLNYPIDKYTGIIFFDSEVTRKDIIEISEKVNKSKIQYVHNINELENVLNNTK